MLSRSSSVVFMLGLVYAGVLAGCGNSSTGNDAGKDAGQDARPADKDTASVPDGKQGADASRADDRAADAEPVRKDVAGDDANVVEPDTAADIVERRDVVADSMETKDAPWVDLPMDATGVVDGKAIDAFPANDVGKPTDTPADQDSKPEIDSKPAQSCEGLLLDNAFPPETYPALYREPPGADAAFTTRTSTLLSTYGLATSDYTFDHTPISWAATLQQGNGPCTLVLGGTSSAATFLATARSFLSKWGDVFQYKDNGKESVPASCDSKLCMVTLTQDYCGLPLLSKEPSYRGDLRVDTYAKDGCLWRAISHFVPMVPIPRNVLLSDAKLKQALLGLTLTYTCPTGERSVQVGEQDTFIIAGTPTVHVRKSLTVPNALEYRLAVGVVVALASSPTLAWTIYVDGLDGTVLESLPGFICG